MAEALQYKTALHIGTFWSSNIYPNTIQDIQPTALVISSFPISELSLQPVLFHFGNAY